MRSLTAKLSMAFLVMGVMVALLVALIVTNRTRQEFDEFVLSDSHADMIEILLNYYAQNKTWDGVNRIIDRDPILKAHRDTLRVSLVNASHDVFFSYQEEAIWQQ